jgi:alpha-glucosidase
MLNAKRLYEAIGSKRTPVWEFTDGSRSRILSRSGHIEELARLTAMFQVTQRGMIILYYGQELGMPDSKIPFYKRLFKKTKDRRAQGPMLWSTGEGRGFSLGEPWIPFARGANRLSVENQLLEEGSMLQLNRTLNQLRTSSKALRRGICTFIDTANPHLLAYIRETEDERLLNILNFNERVQRVGLKEGIGFGMPIFSTYRGMLENQEKVVIEQLDSYEGLIVRLEAEE